MPALLDIRNLSLAYDTDAGPAVALDGVDLTLERGDALGVLGESGCGKTTLAYALIRLLPANARIQSGQVLLDGDDVLGLDEGALRRLRWRRISMVFQNAMSAFDPVYRVGALLREILLTHFPDEDDADEKLGRVLDLVRLPRDVADRYPHQLSGGMRQRVGIAASLICDPDVILLDEPTTALDVLLQERILDEIRDLRARLRLTFVLVSHDIAVIAEVADRVAVMYAGQVVETCTIETLFDGPRHPYTQLLVASVPKLDGKLDTLKGIPGAPPDLVTPPPGCRFHPRCPSAVDACRRTPPPRVRLDSSHSVLCHLPGESR